MLIPSKGEIETAEMVGRHGYTASNGEPRRAVSLSMFMFFMVHQREFCNGAIHIHQRRSKSQRALFGITPQASVREHQTATQRGHPHLAILSIFNSLRSGRALTRDVCVTPLLPLPTIFSLHGETWHFLQPREREQRVEHRTYNVLLHCTPNLPRWRLLAYRSLLLRERAHSINFPDEFHGSIIKRRCPGAMIHTTRAAFEQLNCREELPALPIIWQVPILGLLIPLLMCVFILRGIKKRQCGISI